MTIWTLAAIVVGYLLAALALAKLIGDRLRRSQPSPCEPRCEMVFVPNGSVCRTCGIRIRYYDQASEELKREFEAMRCTG